MFIQKNDPFFSVAAKAYIKACKVTFPTHADYVKNLLGLKSTAKVSKTEYTPEFTTFWNTYPRQTNKQGAFGAWNARLNAGVTQEDMLAAASKYRDQCKADGTEERFIMHPATFLGRDGRYAEFIQQPCDFDDFHPASGKRISEMSLMERIKWKVA